jgi:hypothetical protein
MCRSINSITDNPVVGAYAHLIWGAHQYQRLRVTHLSNDRRTCEVTTGNPSITYIAVKQEAECGIWRWSVPGLKAVINFTNVPQVGYVAEYSGTEGTLERTTVAEVSDDGTEVLLADGTAVTLAEYGGYPNTRFKPAR